MIRQNIRIAFLVLFVFIGLWAIAAIFIKLDVSTQSIINLTSENPIIAIENKDSTYIENHEISKLKIEYEKEYFSCQIYYQSKNEQYTNYIIMLPEIIPKTTGYMVTNVIIDKLNVYQYWFKK